MYDACYVMLCYGGRWCWDRSIILQLSTSSEAFFYIWQTFGINFARISFRFQTFSLVQISNQRIFVNFLFLNFKKFWKIEKFERRNETNAKSFSWCVEVKLYLQFLEYSFRCFKKQFLKKIKVGNFCFWRKKLWKRKSLQLLLLCLFFKMYYVSDS